MVRDVSSDMPMLVRIDDDAGMRWVLQADRMVIGRDPVCDVLIPDRRVSREHAEIRRTRDGFTLVDRDSKNGTFVNGQRVVGEYHLNDGDEIQIALCCELIFVGPGATAPLVLERQSRANLTLDERSHRLWVGGVELVPPLSLAQFRFLHLLWNEPERVFSREEVAQAVWPDEDAGGISEQAIDAVVRRLRERLVPLGADALIVTVRGHGFRLNLSERQ